MCKLEEEKEFKRHKVKQKRNSITSRIMRSFSPQRDEEDTPTKQCEMKDMNHQHNKCESIKDFMKVFSALPIYERMTSKYESEYEELQQGYNVFLGAINQFLENFDELHIDYNMEQITKHISQRYLKYDKIKQDTVGQINEKINSKLEQLRLVEYSKTLDLPEDFKNSHIIK